MSTSDTLNSGPLQGSAVPPPVSRVSSGTSETTLRDDFVDNTEYRTYEPTTRWEKVLQTTEKHDKDTVETWKDELNNLLIFTGLFSAVVTAFTVESYKWLQKDSGDSSVQLLSQISLQLSSFSAAATFVNSTAPALPLHNVTSVFSPAQVAVNVNILWVLSLTLSLLSALFAIAVQQWLRHLRLPPQLDVRTALKLRQLRYENLRIWQVPSIVSLLPVLVQIAVVLFLVGLLLLLSSLNHVVTVPFIAVAGVGIIIFAVTTIIPLFNVFCSYKTPLIPTILIVLQWLTYPLALLAAVPYSIVIFVCEAPRLRRFTEAFSDRDFYMNWVYWPGLRLMEYARSFGAHIRVDLNHFWTHKELGSAPLDPELECRALSGTLMAMPQHLYRRTKGCVEEFMVSIRMNSALEAVVRSLGFNHVHDVLQYYPRLTGNALLHARAARCISWQHAQMLLDALPLDTSASDIIDTVDSAEAGRILLLLYQATKGLAAKLLDSYFAALRTIRDKQDFKDLDIISARKSIPTLLLFESLYSDSVRSGGESLPALDPSQAVNWARNCLDISSQWAEATDHNSTLSEMVLASTATAFLSIAKKPQKTELRRVLPAFVGFLRRWKEPITQYAHLSHSRKLEYLPFMVTVDALRSICSSLAVIGTRTSLIHSLNSADGRHAESMATHLRDICQGPGQRSLLFTEALANLDVYLQSSRNYETLDLTGFREAEDRLEILAAPRRPQTPERGRNSRPKAVPKAVGMASPKFQSLIVKAEDKFEQRLNRPLTRGTRSPARARSPAITRATTMVPCSFPRME